MESVAFLQPVVNWMAFLHMPGFDAHCRCQRSCEPSRQLQHRYGVPVFLSRKRSLGSNARHKRARIFCGASQRFDEASTRPVVTDYATLAHCVAALCAMAVPARVENVLQPSPTTLMLQLRTLNGLHYLTMSFSQTHGRLTLHDPSVHRGGSDDCDRRPFAGKRSQRYTLGSTALSLLLTCALVSATIATEFDRVAKLAFAPSPTSEPSAYIFLELLGNGRSNIVLTDADLSIKACGRQIPPRSSSRSLQTGGVYYPPSPPGGIHPSDPSMRDALTRLAEERPSTSIAKLLTRFVAGVSPAVAELICSAALPLSEPCAATIQELQAWDQSWADALVSKLKVWNECHGSVEKVRVEQRTPRHSGFDIVVAGLSDQQLDSTKVATGSETIGLECAVDSGNIIERYYFGHEKMQSLAVKVRELQKTVKARIARAKSRADSYASKMKECEMTDLLKQDAEFLYAYAHTWSAGDRQVIGEWLDSTGSEENGCSPPAAVITRTVELPDDERSNPTDLASQMYRKANKLERARGIVESRLEDALAEVNWLEGVGVSIDMARSEADLLEIEQELEDARDSGRSSADKTASGSKKKTKLNNAGKGRKASAKSSNRKGNEKHSGQGKSRSEKSLSHTGVVVLEKDGLQVMVGRNARGNENVTFALSRREDVWLHAAGTGGAHVVARLENGQSMSDMDDGQLQFAADVAAFFSKASQSANVPVTVAPAKDMRRAPGTPRRLGSVIIPNSHRTLYAKPVRIESEARNALDQQ